jgi:4-hydroxy-tetrahydrodipicolinate reductase
MQSKIQNPPSKIVILGAAGRMGRTLVRGVVGGAVPGLKLTGAVDLWDAPERGKDAGIVAGAAEAGVAITTDLAAVAPGCDVIIDFTSHHGTAGNAPRIAGWGKAWVIGTTGVDTAGRAAIEAAAKSIPIVWAPNMSLGVNLLFALLEQAGRALKDKGYDVEIIERHHRRKKDAPSGTALGLGQAVARGMDLKLDDVAVHGRQGIAKTERSATEIGFHAVRGGDIVGDHTVMFATDGELLEFSHRATSRDTFALGALRATAWVAGKPAGLYSMRDVLGI